MKKKNLIEKLITVALVLWVRILIFASTYIMFSNDFKHKHDIIFIICMIFLMSNFSSEKIEKAIFGKDETLD